MFDWIDWRETNWNEAEVECFYAYYVYVALLMTTDISISI